MRVKFFGVVVFGLIMASMVGVSSAASITDFDLTTFDFNGLNDGFDLAFHTVVASVPEPGTMLLFGTGLVGLYFAGIRQKKRHS